MKDIVETAVTFDHVAFSAAVKDFLATKENNKSTRLDMKSVEGKAELLLLETALTYGADTFDLQPLAFFVKETKPSPIAKRIIKSVFPSHVFALIGDDKRPAFVVSEGMAKVSDAAKIAVITDAAYSGDSIHCDQIKAAFPEPVLNKSAKVTKLSDAILKRMKADGITKADLLAMVQGFA